MKVVEKSLKGLEDVIDVYICSVLGIGKRRARVNPVSGDAS